MNDSLVLDTSYFNLIDGRRQDTADTFRMESDVPSGTSPDGLAALYIVTEASTGGQMGPKARRLAADTVAWEFASQRDLPASSRLRGAIRTAHRAVYDEFEGHVAVGMSVIAVEGNEVYLAQVAPAQVYVLHEGNLSAVAAESGASPYGRSIGSRNGPRISLARDIIGEGDILVLCSSWFQSGPDTDDLRDCFAEGTAEDIAESLHDLARRQGARDACAIVIEGVPAAAVARERDPGPGLFAQVDEAVSALVGFGRMLVNELKPYDTPERPPARARRARDETVLELDEEPVAVPRRRQTPLDLDDERPATHTRGGARQIAPEEHTIEMPVISPDPPVDVDDLTWRPATREPVEDSDVESAALSPMPVDDLLSEPAENVTAEPEVTPEPEPEPERPRKRDIEATQEIPVIRADDEPADDEQMEPEREVVRHPRRGLPRPDRRWRARRTAPLEPPLESAAARDPELDEVNARLDQDVDMTGVLPPVQGFADAATTEPSRIYATSKDLEAANRRPRRFGGIARPVGRDPQDGPPVIRPGLADLNLRQPVARAAPPAVIWFSIAAVFVLAGAALFLYYQHHHKTVATNPYPALVAKDIALARAARLPLNQDYYLNKALVNLAHARANGTKPAKIGLLTARYNAAYDAVHVITRERTPGVLADFTKYPSAHLTELATGPGVAFVLDAGRKAVYSVPLNASPSTNPSQVLQDGAQVTGYTIGMPVQLTTSVSTPLILDDHNTLVRGTGADQNATSLVQSVQTPPKIAEISNTGPDIYELDTANNQVWRYPGAVSGIDPAPQAYFTPNGPNLKSAVSLVLDGTSLFVLNSNGTVLKFDNQANPQAFTMHLRDPMKSPNLIFTDTGLNYVWIADPGTQRIVQLDKGGRYVRSYAFRRSNQQLSHIDGLTVVGKTLYVLSGSKIFDFPVVP